MRGNNIVRSGWRRGLLFAKPCRRRISAWFIKLKGEGGNGYRLFEGKETNKSA